MVVRSSSKIHGVRRGKTDTSSRHQRGMTLHKVHDNRPWVDTGPVDVETWRTQRLLEAGFPAELAAEVAADPGSDLHALLQLVDEGCPPDLAVRITSPLPGQA